MRAVILAALAACTPPSVGVEVGLDEVSCGTSELSQQVLECGATVAVLIRSWPSDTILGRGCTVLGAGEGLDALPAAIQEELGAIEVAGGPIEVLIAVVPIDYPCTEDDLLAETGQAYFIGNSTQQTPDSDTNVSVQLECFDDPAVCEPIEWVVNVRDYDSLRAANPVLVQVSMGRLLGGRFDAFAELKRDVPGRYTRTIRRPDALSIPAVSVTADGYQQISAQPFVFSDGRAETTAYRMNGDDLEAFRKQSVVIGRAFVNGRRSGGVSVQTTLNATVTYPGPDLSEPGGSATSPHGYFLLEGTPECCGTAQGTDQVRTSSSSLVGIIPGMVMLAPLFLED